MKAASLIKGSTPVLMNPNPFRVPQPVLGSGTSGPKGSNIFSYSGEDTAPSANLFVLKMRKESSPGASQESRV